LAAPIVATVEPHSIERRGTPAVEVTLPKSAKYVGGERFTLYDNADCELHVFVEADAKRRVRRLYWVQFEEFLARKPDARYSYGAHDKRMNLWDQPVWVATGFGRSDQSSRPGSDRDHVNALLARAGYSSPPTVMQVRMVRLLDDDGKGYGRRELMLIYGEDLDVTHENYAALGGDGAETARWKSIEPALIERASTRFKLKVR
jgi:hypothetical protein